MLSLQIIQSAGKKKKTDISAPVANPIFTQNIFSFPLQKRGMQLQGLVSFTAFMVLSEGDELKGESKIMGQGQIDLNQISNQLVDLSKGQVTQQVKLSKNKQGKQIQVGRLFIMLRITDQMIPTYVEQIQQRQLSYKHSQKSLDKKQKKTGVADIIGQYSGINLTGVQENQKLGVLARQLSSKQEIVHRLLRQLDDKSQSLRLTAAEIVDLRKQIKLLQSENSVLRQQSQKDQSSELKQMVLAELQGMNADQLKKKVLNLAQAYRNQKNKKNQIQQTLHSYEKQITNFQQVKAENLKFLSGIKQAAQKIVLLKKQNQKVSRYKQTLKKQQKVIQRLQKIVQRGFKQGEAAKKLLHKNQQLQIQNKVYKDKKTPQLQEAHQQIQRLKRIIANLQKEYSLLLNTSPQQKIGQQGKQEELQFLLMKAQARNQALQQQMTQNSKNYARQLATLRLKLAQKQALLDGMSY